MKIPVYSLKDCKVGFGSLFPMANDEIAKNSIVNSFLSSQSNPIQQTPQDFELYKVGEYDDSTGDFEAQKYLIGTALDIINEAKGKREVARQLRLSMLKESNDEE